MFPQGLSFRPFVRIQPRPLISVLAIWLLLPGFWEAGAQTRTEGTSSVEIVLHEGTNVAAALSPDGETLAIDLQGRIWVLPARGGPARALTDALGDARQPAWSPDGRRIVFQAYWDGNYHIWSVRPDGEELLQHTWGPFDHREPHWSPDGNQIAFSSDRGGSYHIWVLDVRTGELDRWTRHEGNEFTPAWSPDGEEIAFASDRGSAPGIHVVGADGQERFVAPVDGSPAAPAWSPDGRRLVYNRILNRKSALLVVEVGGGGSPQVITDPEEDVFPFRATWTERGEILYSGDGKIRVRPAEGGSVRDVPFQAAVSLSRPPYRRRAQDFDGTEARPVKGIGTPVLAPDGRRVAFTALGDLWVLQDDNPVPQRLTSGVPAAIEPAWSWDGHRLAYASDRHGGMDLWVLDLESGVERKVTDLPGAQTQPAWSPDGTELSFLDGGLVRVVNLESGAVRSLLDAPLNSPGRPTWSPNGKTLALSALQTYSSRFREGVNRILLLPSAGGAPRTVEDFLPHRSIGSRGRDGPLWSPDGTMFAFVMDGLLWIVPVDMHGEPLGPPRRLTGELADYPSWSGDSRALLYLSGDRLRRVHLADGRTEDVPLDLTWRPAHPTGRTVIHAGGVVDGRSGEVMAGMDVIVEGHRIVAVVPHEDGHHTGTVVDFSDGTVIPGLIEMHGHERPSDGESLGRNWLAFGITSVRDPAADPYLSRERQEATLAGKWPAPRTFRSGPTFDGSRIFYSGGAGMEAGALVELELERARVLEYDLIKTYVRLPDALQRRVVQAAHEMGIPVTSHELYPGVGFGVDGVEHLRGTSRRGYSSKVSELGRSYQDVVSFLTQTDMTITPTMRLYGGMTLSLANDPTLLDDERLGAFSDPELLDRLRAQAEVAGAELEGLARYVGDRHAVIRRIVDGGGSIVAGTDSPIHPYGFALLTELEDYVKVGGLTPLQALQSATVNAARALGAEDDLGAVAPGMLADLVILNGNPLEDIENLRGVRAVMVNGNLHRIDELLASPVQTIPTKGGGR